MTVARKYITSIEPYDPRISSEVDGYGIGFPHVGLKAIAEQMMADNPECTWYGFVNVFSETLKAWNEITPKQLGWIVEIGN